MNRNFKILSLIFLGVSSINLTLNAGQNGNKPVSELHRKRKGQRSRVKNTKTYVIDRKTAENLVGICLVEQFYNEEFYNKEIQPLKITKDPLDQRLTTLFTDLKNIAEQDNLEEMDQALEETAGWRQEPPTKFDLFQTCDPNTAPPALWERVPAVRRVPADSDSNGSTGYGSDNDLGSDSADSDSNDSTGLELYLSSDSSSYSSFENLGK